MHARVATLSAPFSSALTRARSHANARGVPSSFARRTQGRFWRFYNVHDSDDGNADWLHADDLDLLGDTVPGASRAAAAASVACPPAPYPLAPALRRARLPVPCGSAPA